MSEHDPDSAESPSRRQFFKSLSLIPIAAALPAVATTSAMAKVEANSNIGSSAQGDDYRPTFFKDEEWAFVVAACDHLIPADETGPGAVESGVPEFLDRHMQTPYAAGNIWYMQGPFMDAPPQFGYQGKLALRDIVRVGIAAIDAYSKKNKGGKTFAELAPSEQLELLKAAEAGKLQLAEISEKTFFSKFLGEVMHGYFADPKYGGNKNMGAWKMIGYPGVRADYIDWVTVRDKPYPLPPVDLAGKRG